MNATPAAAAIEAAQCTVVLVDYQERLLPAIDQGARALRAACALADVARIVGVPVIGTEQNPGGLGHNVPAVAQRCDAMLTKAHFDGCTDGLGDLIDARGVRQQVVIAGCETHVCLLQTALGLLRQGRRVFVVETGCGSRRSADRSLALTRMAAAGATLVTLEMVFFEWLRTHEHAHFREVLARVKAIDA